jgi:hypothetical protein
VLRLVAEGIVEAKLLDRAPRQQSDDRLLRLVAGIAAAAPDRTLQQIAVLIEAMRERARTDKNSLHTVRPPCTDTQSMPRWPQARIRHAQALYIHHTQPKRVRL